MEANDVLFKSVDTKRSRAYNNLTEIAKDLQIAQNLNTWLRE